MAVGEYGCVCVYVHSHTCTYIRSIFLFFLLHSEFKMCENVFNSADIFQNYLYVFMFAFVSKRKCWLFLYVCMSDDWFCLMKV